MNRETLDRWCERGILGLVLAILIAGPLALGAVPTPAFLVLQGLTLGVMLLWGARFWLNPHPQLLWPPICWAVLAFTLYAIGRYLTADIEYVARQELIHILVYAFLFFAILNNLHRQESTQIIACTLVFLAMAISFYALYQFIARSYYVWSIPSRYAGRGTGTYVSPNNLGGFLEMLAPLGLAYALVGRLKPVMRILLGYASLVILAGIAVTVSRGSWFSTSLMLALFIGVLLFNRTYRLPSLVLLVLLVGAGFYFIPRNYIFQSRLKQLAIEDRRATRDTRVAIWGAAARLWQDNLWCGAGPAHFEYRFGAYRPQTVQNNPELVHNDYLNTLADWGIAGAALIASALVLVGAGAVKTWRYVNGARGDFGGKSGSNRFAFVLGASLGLAAILFHSFVDFNMHIPANAIVAVALMALLSSHLRFTTDGYWVSARLWCKILAGVVLVAGAAYLGQQGWRRAAEYAWQQRVGRAPEYSPEKIDCLKKAFAVEPMNAQTAFAIGEALQVHAREGGEAYEDFGDADYRQLAGQAMEWFGRSEKLDRWNAFSYLRRGNCLDLLRRFDESASCFDRGEQLEPNSYLTMNYVGLHYADLGRYAAARPWFQRSEQLQWKDNPVPVAYLDILNRRLMEAATNEANKFEVHAGAVSP
jgi:O-antigen ligase